MSILIRGMEMPTSFEECQTVLGCCDAFEDGTVWCRLAHGYIGDERTVCPIVPVPPHGRLIDADWVRNDIDKKRPGRSYEDAWALTIIDAAPTIIPASEEGET